MKKQIAVLGATDSIGKNALDVIRATDGFEPVLFSANRDTEGLLALAGEFPDAKIALAGGWGRGLYNKQAYHFIASYSICYHNNFSYH